MCTIDSYCIGVVANVNLVDSVSRWNAVQAILRKAAEALHALLCVLQGTVFLVFMLSGVYAYQNFGTDTHHFLDVYPLLPAGLVMIGIVRLFFTAAEVTERCTRVPSLVNACIFGPGTDADRQYLVQYIVNSSAGFYMFQVRITSQMTVKFAHVCAVATFAVLTQILQ